MGALLALQIQISLTVLLALLLRYCMNRLPKLLAYGLWIIVFLRLLIPVSMESPLGILPGQTELERMWQQMTGTESSGQPGKAEGELLPGEETAYAAGGQQAFISGENKDIPTGAKQQSGAVTADGEQQELRNLAENESSAVREWLLGADSLSSEGQRNSRLVFLAVWFTGLAAVLGYNILVMSRIHRQIRDAEKQEGEVYCCAGIDTPFTMGILQPRIYLPTGLEPEKRACVLCHERIHIRRRDYLVKGIAFLLTAVYWYNPLVWVAFYMLEQDMEMSCDEAVVQSMGDKVRRAYSQSLLDFAAGRRSASIMPPAFGEHGVKQRVKNILTGKRNRWWGILAGVFILAAAALLIFSTSGSGGEPSADIPSPVPSPRRDSDNAIAKGQVAGKIFVYTGETFSGIENDPFSIVINKDGTYTYSESVFSSYLGIGTWKIRDGILVLTEDKGQSFQNCFRIDGEELVFVEEGSNNFTYVKVQDGERFVCAGILEAPDLKPGDQVTELSWECYEQIYDGKESFYLNTRYGIYRKEEGPEGDIYTCLYPRYIGAPQSHSQYPRLTLHPNLDKLYFVTDSEFTEESLDWWDNCIMSLDLRTLETEIVAQDEGAGSPQLWFDQIDAFYGVYNGKNAKQKSHEWEEMVEYWGEDLLEQYELVRSLEADVADCPGDEMIEVYTLKADSELAGMYGGVVRILSGEGELLMTETADPPSPGRNSLYLGQRDGQNFLMNFYLEDRGTFGGYSYQIYRLTADGEIEPLNDSAFSWDYDESLGEKALLYNDEVFHNWAEKLQDYMEASQLLISTLENEVETDPAVRPYRYNYDSLTRGHAGEELKGRTDS